MSELQSLLQRHFQYETFRPGQKDIIQSVLEGKNVVGILPTGAGKTLCYHLPAKVIQGMTIIVSPLLSLMEDQVHQLRASGEKNVVQLNGFMTKKEKNFVLNALNVHSMLYVSPEMISNPYVLSYLQNVPIGLFVVDEAHCISQWGHEFRTDYLRLKDVLQALRNPRCLALTATATKIVEEDIITHLNMENPRVHRFSVDRKNIKYFMKGTTTINEKEEQFFHTLHVTSKPAIIYTSTRHEAERICHKMKEKGYGKTAFYHAGMGKEERLLVQHQFLNGELDYICSTNAFGMGINKPNVRTVIHLHIPSSIEHYVQEVGRAGRDGKDSVAVLIYGPDDRYIPISFIENEFPTENELNVWLQSWKGMDNVRTVKTSEVKNMFFIDETKWRMVLYYLELEQVVQGEDIILNRLTNQMLERLNKHFLNRKREKLALFHQFEAFISSGSCIREGLLQHFGEKPTEHMEYCCEKCGLSLEMVVGEPKNEATSKMERPLATSWQEKLKAILLPQSGGDCVEK